MNEELAQFHLDRLNKRFLSQYDVDLGLSVVSVASAATKVEYDADYTLPLDIIKVIGNYFRSFNVVAYINNNHSD